MAGYDFDLLTIGAGSGGVRASRMAASYGAKVAIAEESRVGGTCVLRGCVPKKLLVIGSHFAEDFHDANGYGWSLGAASHDWPRLIAAKDQELARLNGVYLRMLHESGVSLLEGRAKLVDAHRVEINGQQHSAERILIATGSWPHLPAIPGIELAISSNEALDLPQLPQRVAVVGGGYIAVEFAGIFNAFGAEVVQLVRGDTLLRGFDDDIAVCLAEEMQKKGIDLRWGTQVTSIERRAEGGLRLKLKTKDAAAPSLLEVDQVLYATGRKPNSQGLGLAELGVKLDGEGAVVVDRFSQSSVPSIFAVGDVTNRMNLTPVAIAEARCLVETLFNGTPQPADYENIPSAVFSQPPVGTVGLAETEARQRFGAVDVYVTRFRSMRHTLSGRDERTMMKLVVRQEDQTVVGCHMVGSDAPEIVQGLAIAMKAGATKAHFDATIGIHPTAAEEFVTLREKRADPPPPS
ncbi:MAG TPA: glutathione-disulfide reductase [Rhodospirillaceae bacterium]|nr:glutathione-disulfide reductase [Rhodospirillaceae bacterium]